MSVPGAANMPELDLRGRGARLVRAAREARRTHAPGWAPQDERPRRA
ncbi:MAG: hypothetical protein ACTHK2_10155 [Dokdonella sp.]